MKAVILAAGIGSRLKKNTKTKPKCLVKIGEKSIIDYQIKALTDCNINEIIIVTGYKSEMVEDYLKEYKIIKNSDYQKTNSMYSLWLTKEEVFDSDFILLNGDVIVEKESIKKLSSNINKTSTLVIQREKCTQGEMNLIVEGTQVKKIGKNIEAKKSNFESAQITFFSSKASKFLFYQIEKFINKNLLNLFPAKAYFRIINEIGMEIVTADKSKWFEIDTEEDLFYARENIHKL